MSSKIQKAIKIATFILVSLIVLFNGAFAFFVIGAGIFEYNLSLFSLQFVIILILLIFWIAILVFLIIKRSNIKFFNIIAGFIFVYLLVGVIMYYSGGETRGISIVERIVSISSVATGWPLFLASKIFFN